LSSNFRFKAMAWYDQGMTTLAEIEAAAESLPQDQQKRLLEWLAERLRQQNLKIAQPHSVLDIPPVSLGKVIRPLQSDDDLLGEMLEGRG
jgi:hypothetical protein